MNYSKVVVGKIKRKLFTILFYFNKLPKVWMG